MLSLLGRRTSRGGGDADRPGTTLGLERLMAMRAAAAPSSRVAGQRGLTHMPGLARTRIRGRGLEFDDLRPYAEGDDVRHIDWNVTARTGRPHTRQFREERERAVTIAVDMRASMFTGSQRLKAVVAGELAAAIAWRVAAERDRAGLFAFDDERFVATRPALREKGVSELAGELAGAFGEASLRAARRPEPRPLADALAWINAARRAAGAFVLVTGLDDPGTRFAEELREAGRRARLGVVLLRDPLERAGLPPGSYRYRSGGRVQAVTLDRGEAQALRERLTAELAAQRDLLESAGISFVEVGSDADIAAVLTLVAARGMI